MHFIPVNVIDNGCIGGTRIKTRNAIEAGVIAIGVFLLMKIVTKLFFTNVPFLIITILFLVFGIFPAVIALIGIGNESLSEAVRTYRAYKKTKDFLPYSMAQLFPEIETPKEKKKSEKAEKRTEKKAAKAEKKAAKAQLKEAKKASKRKGKKKAGKRAKLRKKGRK